MITKGERGAGVSERGVAAGLGLGTTGWRCRWALGLCQSSRGWRESVFVDN